MDAESCVVPFVETCEALAAGAFTGAAGLWLVDWHGAAGTRTSLVVVPGAIGLGGTFR